VDVGHGCELYGISRSWWWQPPAFGDSGGSCRQFDRCRVVSGGGAERSAAHERCGQWIGQLDGGEFGFGSGHIQCERTRER
jgi:hypothetical protein